ncbi:MAG TPA: metallophosphoesterase, partial [Cyclobacteriaceae bacterium]|nr:metallophosphoesterase [Cyclobacteriaceae bacterium]
ILLGVIDFYLVQAVLAVSRNWSPLWKSVIRYGFWIPTVVTVVTLAWYNLSDPYKINRDVWLWLRTFIMGTYLSKFFGIIFVFVDDLQRGVRWAASFFYKGPGESLPGEAISRSEFLTKAALVASAVPFGAMTFGIVSGAHDYRVRKSTVVLPNLPKAFDGMKIGQVSDIHSGSFWNKTAVSGGVDMMLAEKPDIIFFTGDLVNDHAEEVKDYVPIFGKFKAPLGVYSTTGNHDYGDYAGLKGKVWDDNLRDLRIAHKEMGFDILMNQNRIIEQGGEKIAILGIENWGAGRFSKYGKLDQAYKGSEEAAVKLLLSHDPSHWDAQVRPNYPDIDMMFSGHTHGFQFGVEIGGFKWSPSQYVYKQWAGLYNEGKQYLYVNRGYGYLGYPGRIGMPPELTVIELKRA